MDPIMDPTSEHEVTGERLVAYLFDELPPVERQHVEAHLAACPSCRRELAWHRWTLAALRCWPAIEPAPALDARLFAAAERLLAERRQQRALAAAQDWHTRHWWAPALALPLALAVLLLGGMLLVAPLSAPLLDRPGRLGGLGPLAVATLGGVPLVVNLALSGLLLAVLVSAATWLPVGRGAPPRA